MKVGVLGIQGDVREHLAMLRNLGAETVIVKTVADLEGVQGLVLPGGESTTIGMLMKEYGLIDALRQSSMPMFGTCAGAILMAREVVGSTQPGLRVMDIEVSRNAFGRQRESFEADLPVKGLRDTVHAVFIRAPVIVSVGAGVDVLATVDDRVVLCREGRYLAASFHPEMTDDSRLHRYFLEDVIGA